jgi:hypothetical protein
VVWTYGTAPVPCRPVDANPGVLRGGVRVCAYRYRGAMDGKVDAQGRGLGEDVADLRIELAS